MKNVAEIREGSLQRLATLDLNKKYNYHHLPYLSNVVMRPIKEICARLALLAGFKGITFYHEDLKEFGRWINDIGLSKYLSNEERQALKECRLTESNDIDFSWYQESGYALVWVLGFCKEMKSPTEESDFVEYCKFIPPETELDSFFQSVEPRSIEHVLIELDYYYLLNWVSRRGDKVINHSVFVKDARHWNGV